MKYCCLLLITLCVAAVAVNASNGFTFCDNCLKCVKYQTRILHKKVCAKYGVEYFTKRCGFLKLRKCKKTRSKCVVYRYLTSTYRECSLFQKKPYCKCKCL